MIVGRDMHWFGRAQLRFIFRGVRQGQWCSLVSISFGEKTHVCVSGPDTDGMEHDKRWPEPICTNSCVKCIVSSSRTLIASSVLSRLA